ncbi:MAG: ATP-binding protein, partial [Bacteroidota bacterium]
QIQNLLIEKIETLESTNDRLSHEINERRKIEQELKESESLLNKIIESAMDAMVLLNANGNIDYWSIQSEKLMGWSRSEIIGQMFSEKLLPLESRSTFNDVMRDFVLRTDPTEQKKRFETRLINKLGTQIDVEISMTSVKLKEQYIVSAFIRDIGQRKDYEREIIEARDKAEEASAAKLTFLSMMSHEIRTPLNAVIGTTQLLLEEDPRKDQLENLNILKFSAENLLSIINDILDFNKAEEGKLVLENKPFNLEVLCNNVVNSFTPQSKEKGIAIKFDNKLKRINLVSGDETRLSQVLINLFGNAVKFTSRGSVALSVELINLNNRVGEVKFEVIDSGIGIPKEKIARIFDRFTQVHEHDSKANYGGTGLGLPIAKNIVKLMGGDLAISSLPGIGSTFYFSIKLPIPFKEGVQATKSNKEEFAAIHNKRILIVEDHKINQIVATKFLKKYQCEIDIAENGQEAVKIMEESPCYDLILMDLEMPVMNGYEAALAIRKIETGKPQTPIVALSANALLDVSKKVQEAGMNGYISKPFEAAHFYAQIADNIR